MTTETGSVVPAGRAGSRHRDRRWSDARRWVPRGNLLDDAAWRQRHRILWLLLAAHVPALGVFGLLMGRDPVVTGLSLVPILVLLLLGALIRQRRVASVLVSAGLVYCSAALVALSGGYIEAHFHFFVMIPFIALYQDWVPFIWEIAFVVLSHGIGSAVRPDLMFNTHGGMHDPWVWSLIHGAAVLAACVGMVLYWRTSEDEQEKNVALSQELAAAELQRRRFVSDLLVNLARRNQSLLYRQLDIINQLEEQERDPDQLAELFRLDHLATRIRRNAENLLVMSGEEPPRVWSKPVRLTDVVRAAIAETEDLDRVVFVVDERLAVVGHAVSDVTHLLAELIENAVRSSPPDTRVTVRSAPDVRSRGTVVLSIEDWGIGMPPADLDAANRVLAAVSDVDAVLSSRLGLHVVSRLARRWSIETILTDTSGAGITAVVMLPPDLFATGRYSRPPSHSAGAPGLGSAPPAVSPAGPAGPGVRRPGPATLESRAPSRWAAPHPDPVVPEQAFPDALRDALPTPPPRPEAPETAGIPLPAVAPPAALPAAAEPAGDTHVIQVAEDAEDAEAGSALPRLAQRTPQSHMAPQLRRRRNGVAVPPPAPPVPPAADAERAREALSRYQANRQAALARQDEEQGRA